jgi:hypothetical protein
MSDETRFLVLLQQRQFPVCVAHAIFPVLKTRAIVTIQNRRRRRDAMNLEKAVRPRKSLKARKNQTDTKMQSATLRVSG